MRTGEWLSRLVSFNSISNQSNLPLIEACVDWFQLQGIPVELIYDKSKTKANLFVTIPAKNGNTQGGLMLAGHTDVVPVAGQLWDSDPFIAMEKNGNIYGRGTCDMKGFLAVLLALTPEFKKLNLIKPIHFSFTYDEEVGCIGADFLVEHLKKTGIRPEGCIVGEPSSMRPIIGEKARQVFHCQVKGWEVHSSLASEGCNAIEYASRLICYIKKLSAHLKEAGPFDEDFDFPFTTITTNIIGGGIASNIIPNGCEFVVEMRYLPTFPHHDLQRKIQHYIKHELLPEMHKIHPETAIYLDQISDVPGFNALEDSSITKVVRSITGVNERLKVSYTTEAGTYEDANIPTIICGPGNIEQAHRPNEFISLEQLHLCEKTLRHIVSVFCQDARV